jgi:hypothetical protein
MGVALLSGIGLGCVERRYIVRSNPSGSLLYVNGRYEGPTPQDGYIVYYGKYNFVLAKDGYETVNIVQKYPAPWYELPGLDFIAENIIPFKIRDVRVFEYTLQPAQTVGHAEVLQHAIDLRTRGKGIGTKPLEPARVIAPAPAPGAAPLPAPALEPPGPNENAPVPRPVPPPPPGPLATLSSPPAPSSSLATVTPAPTPMATISTPAVPPPPSLATVTPTPAPVATISPVPPAQGSIATVTPAVGQPGGPGMATITGNPAPAGR